MSRTSRRSRLLIALAPVLVGGLAACGDDSGGSAAGSVSAPAPSAASTSPSMTSSAPVSAPTSSAPASPPPAGAPPAMPPGAAAPTGAPQPNSNAHPPAAPAACAWQPGAPSVIATPCSGLANGQTVTIRGRGFAPGKPVLAVECIDNASGPSDCNLPPNLSLTNLPQTWEPNPDGTVTISLKVVRQFNGHTCSAGTPCVVSISSIDQSEEPSAPITFE